MRSSSPCGLIPRSDSLFTTAIVVSNTFRSAIRNVLAEAGIEPSVGNVDDSYENALAETIIGLNKAELIHKVGPCRGIEQVEFATLDWVD